MQWPSFTKGKATGITIQELADTHYSSVLRFCGSILPQDLAADAAQETFMIAQQQLSKLHSPDVAKSWLFGIANNVCRNHRRKGNRAVSFAELLPIDAEPFHSDEDRVTTSVDLARALEALSDEHREIVVMHEITGLTYEEIATTLNIPVGTVKSRLYYAFRALRTNLNPTQEPLS